MKIIYLNNIENIDEDIFNAFRMLNKSGFGVWLYIYKNRPQQLNKEIITKELNFAGSSFYTGITELLAKGFLLQKEKENYIFVPFPN